MKVLELAAWGRTAVEGFSWPFVGFSKAFQSPSKYSLIYCKAFWNPAITETFEAFLKILRFRPQGLWKPFESLSQDFKRLLRPFGGPVNALQSPDNYFERKPLKTLFLKKVWFLDHLAPPQNSFRVLYNGHSF